MCAICGKSAFDEVVPTAPQPIPKWTDALDNNELRKTGITAVVAVLFVAVVAFLLTRPDPVPAANSLPPPASTTTVVPRPTTDDRAPSVVGGARPATGFAPGVPREVGEGLSPWETPPPMNVVTGALLDQSLDFSVDIARVATLLDQFPDAFTLVTLDPPVLTTFDGELDTEQVESTQPAAVRTITHPDGTLIGELWLLASGGSAAGDAYFAAAQGRWNAEVALDQFAPDVGLRLWLLVADDTTNLWAGEIDDDALMLVRAPTSVEPSALTDVLRAWRRSAN